MSRWPGWWWRCVGQRKPARDHVLQRAPAQLYFCCTLRSNSHATHTHTHTHTHAHLQWTARGEVFSAQDIAGKLIDKGLEDQSKDNMSAIVVQLPDGPRFQEKRGGAGAEAAAYAGAGGGGSSSGSSSAGGGSAAAALQAQQPSGNPSSYPGTGFSSAMHDPSSLSPSPLASAQ